MFNIFIQFEITYKVNILDFLFCKGQNHFVHRYC